MSSKARGESERSKLINEARRTFSSLDFLQWLLGQIERLPGSDGEGLSGAEVGQKFRDEKKLNLKIFSLEMFSFPIERASKQEDLITL